ncbi:uncharacterized protein LOC106138457 [Amyelois transitella]|uniref:uncharacterized protein LOC106138457 n=1 Tax=Amyelois transitella TaxID=680683 RepID=UPI00299075BC|nr:uncharacterized protein LOC106138457 [Amyelois transitella]
MMSLGWDSLPLLPLRCILQHLSTEDALAAMSTCRHWRNALLLYEGHKKTLKLKVNYLERNMFLARLFRKNIEQLHIYLECTEGQLEKFQDYVLPQFFDAVKLQEIIFIGPSYMRLSQYVPFKLKRIITESLVFKHIHSLKKLAFIGCNVAAVTDESERYTHRHVEHYSRPLLFSSSPADAILARSNVDAMLFSSLQHIIVEYDQVTTEAIESLARLNSLRNLSLNLIGERNLTLRPIRWHRIREVFGGRLNVAVNIISLPSKKFKDVIENVLVEGLPLVSLKVLYCKMISVPVLEHLVQVFRGCLQELVWADCPANTEQRTFVKGWHNVTCEVNPFIMLCWQCTSLRRLAVHGYWFWQYDVVGFVRMCSSLRILEISSVYDRPERLSVSQYGTSALRVLVGDLHLNPDMKYINQVNEYANFKYQPLSWSSLPAGLRARASARKRTEYILQEVASTGVT